MKRLWILMNQAGEPSGGSAPATPAAPPTPPPAAVAPPVPQPGAENEPWFKDRLARAAEQERQKLLTELGVTDPEKAKKLLADAAKAEEEKKTAAEKLGETSKEVERLRADNEKATKALTSHVTSQMAALTDERKQQVRELAPDTDPAGQLHALTVLSKAWGTPPPTPPATP